MFLIKSEYIFFYSDKLGEFDFEDLNEKFNDIEISANKQFFDHETSMKEKLNDQETSSQGAHLKIYDQINFIKVRVICR